MDKIKVQLKNNSYYVHFLKKSSELHAFRKLFVEHGKILIVTDDIVEGLFLKIVESVARSFNDNVLSFVFRNGEKSKNLHTAFNIIDYLAENEFHRNDLIIALGGGVVGDLAGYVASIYMRGIDFVQIPTTLLAAVDASIGGKTAIDIKYGKNLVGTFHQPKAVIEIDEFLRHLPKKLVVEGLSEIVKYGVIYDPSILVDVKDGIEKNYHPIIHKCARAKADIVSQDEKESGKRKILNYGHTLAHAIEECSKHRITHGRAVAFGMMFAAYLSKEISFSNDGFYSDIRNIITLYLAYKPISYPPESLIYYMKKDKKNCDERISFVLSNGKENCVRAFDESELKSYLSAFLKYEQYA